ncbi:MAG TPA: MFS transporter [Anaerolineae bacterium]|nr:MFS transporter [Anaerolineae bacterium]
MSRNLYLILGGIFLFTTFQTMILFLTPLVAAQYGTRAALIGLLVAIPNLIGLLADVPFAILSNHYGRRRSMIVGSGFALVATVLLLVSQSYLGWLLALIVFGFATSLFFGQALAHISESAHPQHHARVQGYNGAIQGIGSFVGALLAGFLANFNMQLAFGTTILFAVVILALMWQLHERFTLASSVVAWRPVLRGYRDAAELLRKRSTIQMAVLVVAIQCIVFWVVGGTFFPLYMTTQLGYNVTLAGIIVGVRNLLTVAASPLFGWTTARFGLLRPVLLTHLVAALTLFFIPLNSNEYYLLLLLSIQGLGLGFTAAGANMLVTAGTIPGQRALGFASIGLIGRSTTLVLPPLLGLMAEARGLSLVFIAGGILATFCAGVLAIMVTRQYAKLDLIAQPDG